jgi:hypothetical protein
MGSSRERERSSGAGGGGSGTSVRVSDLLLETGRGASARGSYYGWVG